MANGNGNGALTPRMKLFAQEYVRDGNGSAAAIRAGYAPKAAAQQASALLTKPKISAYVAELTAAALAKVEMEIAEMCQTTTSIARATVDQLFAPKVNGNPWTLLHPSELPTDIRIAVQSVEVRTDPDGSTSYKYKLHPKLQAIDLLAKLRGLIAKKTELDVVLTWRDVLEKMDQDDAQARALEAQTVPATP